MAAAYRYADGDGQKPGELILADYVDRFGAQAVLGRLMTANELRRIVVVENIVHAYRRRQASDNWPEWEKNYPGEAALLNAAMLLAEGGENG